MKFLWQLTSEESRWIDELVRRHGLTLNEVLTMAGEYAKAGRDPDRGDGEPFEFTAPRLIGPDYFEHRNVPEPNANVDAHTALIWAQLDASIAKHLLDKNPSLAVDLAAHDNSLAWLRFYAARSPNAEQRERLQASVEAHSEKMRRVLQRGS